MIQQFYVKYFSPIDESRETIKRPRQPPIRMPPLTRIGYSTYLQFIDVK
jgi:hypothetical protein